MSVCVGSVGETETWIPPEHPEMCPMCRATAPGIVRRSSTFAPTDMSPEMMARLTMRETRLESRLVMTWAPASR